MSKERQGEPADFEHDEDEVTQDEAHTVELDAYTLMRHINNQDRGSIDHSTVKMQAPDAFATIPMPAVSLDNSASSRDLLQPHTKPIDVSMIQKLLPVQELELDLVPLGPDDEPIDRSDQMSTTQIPIRLEFEAVIEPGGIVRIPRRFLESGHVKPGSKWVVVASQGIPDR
ncbi:hypothetical protein FRD01_11365 [Microvenator marinus]|uniref:Uncharacterized protein n=1 Tax=Microvenator marinus TaxID=2600177 RepID=A0A5B8XPL0_9DELT|nr:hypothetical protein [Microvenator marinus]QED27822.1 hypothetical protein FRD01_11365 [Microvenator marinus]